jgi:hypothetical protein
VAVAVFVIGCKAAVPLPTNLAFGHPFSVDGWSITLNSLDRIEIVRPDLAPLPGTEMWVLSIDATNQTGGEARAGDGYRLQGANGDIVSANPLSIVEPVFGADLAEGGHTSGRLTFNLPSSDAPVAVLVKPGGAQVSVPVP